MQYHVLVVSHVLLPWTWIFIETLRKDTCSILSHIHSCTRKKCKMANRSATLTMTFNLFKKSRAVTVNRKFVEPRFKLGQFDSDCTLRISVRFFFLSSNQ